MALTCPYPGYGSLRVGVPSSSNLINPERWFWGQINFSWSGTYPSGFTLSDLQTCMLSCASHWYTSAGAFPGNQVKLFIGLTANDGSYRQTSHAQAVSNAAVDHTVWTNALAVNIWSARPSPGFYGRFFYPWLSDDWLTGSYLNSAGFALLNPMFFTWGQDFFVNSIKFRPVVWSRLHEAAGDVHAYRLCRPISWLRKRRFRHQKNFAPLPWPDIF
jgi:hypothetical protein